MFVRVQYTNLSSFYSIEARARANLTRNLTRLMLLYNATDIAFPLLTTPSVLTQVPHDRSLDDIELFP
jgi:hypothetical protein